MKYEYLIFDLDGTISDPKDGITRSLNYALSAHGFEEHNEEDLSKFIGPPLAHHWTIHSRSSPDLTIQN